MTGGQAPAFRVAVVARVVRPLHDYGGLQQHVYDLVRSLLDRDVAVTLITQPPARRRPDDPQADRTFRHPRLTIRTVPYYTFPFAGRRGTTVLDRSTAYPWFGWRAGRLAEHLVRTGQVDIVHGFGASVLGYARARRAAGPPGAPLVFNPQGLEEFGATDPSRAGLKRLGYRPLQVAVRTCARAADCVIATDRALVQTVLAHLRIPPERVTVVPNAIEPGECDRPGASILGARLREQAGIPPGEMVLLSVGRLEANKGFDVLARALAALAADPAGSAPPWRWIVLGDGPLRRTLEREIRAGGIERRTAILGRVSGEELHAWYEAAALFVHPTLYEGSSLVTLEAMAHRRPVVATRAGGLPDKVVPGVNGWLVEPGDAAALAGALGDALQDRARLEAMGRESRAIVERQFAWSVAADLTLDVYRRLTAIGRSARV